MHYLCLVKPTFSRMCSDALWVITHALNKPLLTKLLFMSKTKQGFHCNKRLLEGLIQLYSVYNSVQKPYDNSWLCCWMLNRGFWSSEKSTLDHTLITQHILVFLPYWSFLVMSGEAIWIRDLKSASKNINLTFIVLDVGK